MKFYWLALFSAILLSSCSNNNIFKEYTDIPLFSWEKSNVVAYTTPINNDTTNFDIYIPIRYASGNPFKNIPVELTITSPSEKKYIINSDLQLIDDNGDYIGDGAGDIWDVDILVKEQYIFEEQGEYSFDIKHTANRDDLPFIMEVGLMISKMEE